MIKRKTGAAVICITAMISIFAFVYNMYGLIVPPKGAHGVLPYQTRLRIDIPNIDSFFKKQ